MGAYLYECHGDFFDAWDDHVAAQQGYKSLPFVCIEDAEDERRRNIQAQHDFDRAVAAMEEARLAREVA